MPVSTEGAAALLSLTFRYPSTYPVDSDLFDG